MPLISSNDDQKPLVTIITPSYNQGAYIEETILSVIRQDYKNVQYIIIDGGSTDNTLDIINRYRQAIDILIVGPDSGQSDAINKGFALAQGDFVAWLNSDDTYEAGAISVAVEALSGAGDPVLVYGACHIINSSSERVGMRVTFPFDRSVMVRTISNPIPSPAAFFRLEAVRKVGGVDIKNRYTMDFDLFLKLSSIGPVARIDRTLANLRIHSAAKSTDGFEPGLREMIGSLKALRKTTSRGVMLYDDLTIGIVTGELKRSIALRNRSRHVRAVLQRIFAALCALRAAFVVSRPSQRIALSLVLPNLRFCASRAKRPDAAVDYNLYSGADR